MLKKLAPRLRFGSKVGSPLELLLKSWLCLWTCVSSISCPSGADNVYLHMQVGLPGATSVMGYPLDISCILVRVSLVISIILSPVFCDLMNFILPQCGYIA